jgi:hyperosmotically inducible periplasmic protein
MSALSDSATGVQPIRRERWPAYRWPIADPLGATPKGRTMTIQRSVPALALALTAALALSACGRDDNRSAGQKVDEAVAQTRSAAEQARQSTGEAAADVKAVAGDAAITTKINAALAADDQLKATRIDVDTRDGRVTLEGSAPDTGSRERATTLAQAVDGVKAVENRLRVEGKS